MGAFLCQVNLVNLVNKKAPVEAGAFCGAGSSN